MDILQGKGIWKEMKVLKKYRFHIAAVLVAILAVYAVALYRTQKKTLRRLTVCQIFNDKQTNMENCLLKAERDGLDWWMKNCENHGSNIERDGDGEITSCSLQGYLADKINDTEQEEKDRCIEMYR